MALAGQICSLQKSQSFEYAQEQLTTMIPTEVHAVSKSYYKNWVSAERTIWAYRSKFVAI
jgi:hypothetical protein